MINKHTSFLPNKFKKKIFFLDLTFGLGGYILQNIYHKLIAIDRNYYSIFLSRKKYKKNFFIFNIKIKKIFYLLKRFNFININIIIYDQGFNSCEIKNFFYKFKKKHYIKKKNFINKNFLSIFNKIIYFVNKNFFFIINTFNYYDFKKNYLFIKKINLKIKIVKLNSFEISLNNSFKNSKMLIIYV
ncbi:putative S-adenosyl-methyltransferase MraW [Candidatus Carsonella ruddii HT isolate Thao2000]|uniref:Putative S-adenosyl-methyltransferase MraW n=1 Tax=Candidatus Carsonella ruddii HT isolate Thao2000 TaxID=1202539 RepID=J3YQA2_CARRU|nr:S-adenosyl-methyltransferase MraW [Candidatus Carsonella ruddii]AFP84093.1 putative S-adenosyl-methyltransferase MraW [Candidatus Carsonella ruddii HT isolate Thao2000]